MQGINLLEDSRPRLENAERDAWSFQIVEPLSISRAGGASSGVMTRNVKKRKRPKLRRMVKEIAWRTWEFRVRSCWP